MKISLLTDAPKHNLALMKISTWHKQRGDSVLLNMPIVPADYRYASVLFEKNKNKFIADEHGGPAVGNIKIKPCLDVKPDYDLYPHNDFSLGYTFRGCYRKCKFCKVPEIEDDFNHYSIWDFHDSKFKKICLLNNNTFFDKQWRETFEEIWDADLAVIDENGYDLRLLDDEKAEALKNTRWASKIHFAWDLMEYEAKVLHGLEMVKKYGLQNNGNGENLVYVLINYNTTEDEDLHRIQKITNAGLSVYTMPFKKNSYTSSLRSFLFGFGWRKFKTIKEAWKDYN